MEPPPLPRCLRYWHFWFDRGGSFRGLWSWSFCRLAHMRGRDLLIHAFEDAVVLTHGKHPFRGDPTLAASGAPSLWWPDAPFLRSRPSVMQQPLAPPF